MNKFLLVLPLVAALTACGPQTESSTQIERRKQEELSLQAVQSVGMPAITNFAEKRMFKDILELRDRSVPTTTYSYATQYTNPMRVGGDGTHGYVTLPQADPNGLYSPASAEGTWVLCVDHKDGKAKPIYVEPRVIVSPIALQ